MSPEDRQLVRMAVEVAAHSATLSARAVLGKAAHDVNNVLTGIRGARDWLVHQEGLDAEAVEIVEDLDLVLDRLSKLAPSVVPFTGEPADLGPVLSELAELWNALESSEMRVTCPTPQRVACEARAVQAAIMALVASAHAAGANVIDVEVVAQASEAEIIVQDDGAPVSPQGAHRIFDPTRSEGARNGLAGAIARRLTQDVGGYSRAEARDPGMLIALLLPRV